MIIFMKVIETHSYEETELLAARVARSLKKGAVLALFGDLGAGKTVFSRGFARGLGITEPVSSPTFTIVQEYPCPDNSMLYHLDLYRIDNSDAALAFGVDEFLYDKNAYCLLEWPERIPELLPPETIRITIEHIAEERRRLTLPDDLEIQD